MVYIIILGLFMTHFTVKDSNDISIIYITETTVEFTSDASMIKKILEESGIFIPACRQAEFENKKVIHLDKDLSSDPIFAKAFIECYFPNSLRESGFKLIKDTKFPTHENCE